jgi:hypothetical protein
MKEGKVQVNMEYKTVYFETGQRFLDWVSECKMDLSKDFGPQEIKQ